MDPSKTPADASSSAPSHTYRMPLPRLSLTPDARHGPLDGAWWPRCDVLELELPSLIGSLEPDREAAVRVTVDPLAWPGAPRTVMAPGRVITVDPAGPHGGAHVITVDCGTVGLWVLLVVPPGEAAATATGLLALAETGRLGDVTGEAQR
ncbi:DUF5994 family protein [Streptomyces sp. NPDC001381]|uniref:DUF5994 family protein n=1 Tax=Streptomyces sp. NPDC001381 TaxID=3364567 RepID=UPI0036BB95D9